MTIHKFRMMDMMFLLAVAIISDILLAWFGLIGIRLFLSIAYPLIIILYIRWSTYGILSNLGLMVTHLLLYGTIGDYIWPIAILHALATMGFASILIPIKVFRQEERYISTEIYVFMYVIGFMVVFFLELGLFNLFGYKLGLVSHGFNHIINFLFGLLIIFITSRQKDLLVSMTFYLKQKKKEV